MQKRLARVIPADDDSDNSSNASSNNEIVDNPDNVDNVDNVDNNEKSGIYILDYTEKSFVVLGDTVPHSKALTSLGGSFNPNLRIGAGWIFAKLRQESVQNYINTGEITPYQYNNTQKNAYVRTQEPGLSKDKLTKIFNEMRDAYDPSNEYDGASIIDVINQFQKKYC